MKTSDILALRFIPIKVGQFTFPYKKPRGTKAARVLSISAAGIVTLSDGTSMHVSHARAVPAGSIA